MPNAGETSKKADEPTAMDVEKKDVKGKKKKDEEELSDEDQQLKEDLELLVVRVQDENEAIQAQALSALEQKIRTSTSSMTSVPKPLKFLRPHYATLREYALKATGANQKSLNDIVAVLAMTMSEEGSHDSLNFKLRGSLDNIGEWGHEFLRHLAREIAEEYNKRSEEYEGKEGETSDGKSKSTINIDDLMVLVDQIVPFNMTHHAEHEACDLLMEVERIPLILDHVTETNYKRVSLYLESCAQYVPEPEDEEMYEIVLKILKKMNQTTDALVIALKMGNVDEAVKIFEECEDPLQKTQLAYILGRHRMFMVETEDEEHMDIIGNAKLSELFVQLGRELDVSEAKTAEDIYKSHLVESRYNSTVDSARANLATTFVNAFVNAGFGQDKLMVGAEGQKWVYRNKEHGMMSATASLGMVLQWDVLNGINTMDKYTHMKVRRTSNSNCNSNFFFLMT